jgi:hypothetical protein
MQISRHGDPVGAVELSALDQHPVACTEIELALLELLEPAGGEAVMHELPRE